MILTRAMIPLALLISGASGAAESVRPIIDTHIHYSHDAWQLLPPVRAVEVLREAGLARAFVSSSNDDGTQKLFEVAPELIVPVLRPYRRRGETESWMHDQSVLQMLEDRLSRYQYAGIGEFHAFGEDIELPVLQGVIELAREHGLFLHAHSDADAIQRIFAHHPDAVVLWAHSGFDSAEQIAAMLRRYPRLWADLAFRSEHAYENTINPAWRKLFEEFPGRFMLGTDTYTPERWFYVVDHADSSRLWLAQLPDELAQGIASVNALKLLSHTSFGRCAGPGETLRSDGFSVNFSIEPEDIQVGQPFSLVMRICENGKPWSGGLDVDAGMPSHGHGMNYRLEIQAAGGGAYNANGLVFHMPGEWRLSFRLSTENGSLELQHTITLQ